ncbi:MAG: sugar kinase [Candidatus Diapherotrites archaeon]|nr:sugar kinase [Candidatus Diapherotrites archaeon]
MVKVVVVGSIAFDSIKTPFGSVQKALGGSGTYASYASSFFSKTGLVGVIGNDFNQNYLNLLKRKGIDLSGVTVNEKEKTFYWKGEYKFDLNSAITHETQLNAFSSFKPELPEAYKNADYLFLGNISPELQLNVLNQMNKRPKLVLADTMNYYIQKNPELVKKVINEVDIGLMNDSEARMLFNTNNLMTACKKILALNSEWAIIKKGEHGAIFMTEKEFFSAPGYPLENVKDPTGAGDSFAGAMLGYLASKNSVSQKEIKKAIVYGSTVASFNAEGFSLNNLQKINKKHINSRFKEFKKISEF